MGNVLIQININAESILSNYKSLHSLSISTLFRSPNPLSLLSLKVIFYLNPLCKIKKWIAYFQSIIAENTYYQPQVAEWR